VVVLINATYSSRYGAKVIELIGTVEGKGCSRCPGFWVRAVGIT
jgi:hypothetical protein